MKRLLMPWTALALGAMPVLALLLLLPPQFTASPSFTLLLVATSFAAGARLYTKRLRPTAAGGALLLPPALFLSLLVDVGAFVLLELPFWQRASAPHSLAARSFETPEPADHEIYVVEHGWHTGLVLATRDLDGADLPYFKTLQSHRFVEVGWGDAAFFPAADPGLLMAADAMLTPGPSVLHVASFDQPVATFFAGAVLHQVAITASGARRIGTYLAASFADHESAEPVATAEGYYGPASRFVAANGTYYFPRTCNVWTAEALAAGGLPMTPGLAVTSRALLHQVRQIANAAP